MRRLAPALVCCALLVSACSMPTLNLLGAKTGGTKITAVFDDTQDIVQGHTVQVSNVQIGSVIKVEVVKCRQGRTDCGPPDEIPGNNYKSKVTMSITGGDIPVGTHARVHRTSILGEHFVDLEFPPADKQTGEVIKDGGEITEATADPDFEDLALKAGEVIAAISADDLSQTVEALHTGLAGKGPQLNHLIAALTDVAVALDAQRPNLEAAVDGLGRLGATLAPASETIGTLIDDLAGASQGLNQNRDRLFGALGALRDLAQVTNDVLLVPHADRLHTLLSQTADVTGVLAANVGTLDSLISNLLLFSGRIDDAIANSNLLTFAWLDLDGSL